MRRSTFPVALVALAALAAGCGKLSLKCPTGQASCADGCVDITANPENCGGCGNVCGGGKSCINSTCTCTDSQTDCGGTCADLTSNVVHCGACGSSCSGGKICAGSACACPEGETDCSGRCFDLKAHPANCGSCGNPCGGGKTCQNSMCSCPTGFAECGGACFATATDRSHCGATCTMCAPNQICVGACMAAPAVTFLTKPTDPTGWKDPACADISFTFAPVGSADVRYECRTGPDVLFAAGPAGTSATPPWGPCDGADGKMPAHRPTATSGTPEGGYRTEFRYTTDSYTSPVVLHQYYVHHSLDSVATCPRAGMAGDGPRFTDAEYFQAALNYSTANVSQFPTSATFPAIPTIPSRNDAMYLRNPFIKIPFTSVGKSAGMWAWVQTASYDYVMHELSLRHRWVMSADRKMILMKRSYVNKVTGDCHNYFRFGGYAGESLGPLGLVPERGNKKLDCEALVVTPNGRGLCIGGTGINPLPLPIDDYDNGISGTATESPGTAGVGTVSGALNSSTVTGVGTNFTSPNLLNRYIQFTDLGRFWYRVTAVGSTTSLTVSPPLRDAMSGELFRQGPSGTHIQQFVTPSGYAKFHSMPHTEAQGANGFGVPSSNTKCTSDPSCVNDNDAMPRPFMTYLPR